jgi:cytochrome c-type biogenesis protein CcmF
VGQTIQFNNHTVQLEKIERKVNHPGYHPQPEDIAVAAQLNVTGPKGLVGTTRPVYLIRGNQPFSLQDELPVIGLHTRFENIDPKTGVITVGIAQATEAQQKLPLEIAENASRSDYIVLEAIVFPGINFVWLGSIMMLIGLAISFWRRAVAKKRQTSLDVQES